MRPNGNKVSGGRSWHYSTVLLETTCFNEAEARTPRIGDRIPPDLEHCLANSLTVKRNRVYVISRSSYIAAACRCGNLRLPIRAEMEMRASAVSRHLTLNDAIEICRRRLNGEAQHKIAAAYDVNQGRISEILSGKRFPAAKRLAQNGLRDSEPSQT